jgi:hypothetical protein
MATTTQEHPTSMFGHERRFLSELSAGTGSEALVGAGAVVLAIIGLAGIQAFYMAAIATIAVGAALLLEGAVLMAKQAELATDFGETHSERMEAGGGLSAELLGGAAGVILGILALVGVAPMILLAVALIAFGACMLFGATMTSHLRHFALEPQTQHPAFREVAHEATIAATGAQALVSLAAIVLGILALVNFVPMTLILCGMLILGGSILLSGSAMTTWMLAATGRRIA